MSATLNHLTLAVLLGAAVLLGVAPSAQAVPPVTSGLVLHMDAAQITGTANGAQLGTWADTSGLANNAVRQGGSSAGYPMYVTNVLNGKPVVRFNSGGGDSFQFTRISNIRTVFWVLKENAGATADGFLLGDSADYNFHRGGANGPLWNGFADTAIRDAGPTTKLMGNAIDGTATALPSGSFQLVSLVTAPTYYNASGNVRANQICQDRGGNTRSWQGDIAEILIYDRALTSTEENLVGYYLGNKYGLTTAYTASTAKDIFTFVFQGLPATTISGTNITINVPIGTDVTALAPTYTVSVAATGSPVSGTARDFTTPQTYTITAQDGSTKDYTVTVRVNPYSLPPVTSGLVLCVDASQITGTADGAQLNTWTDTSYAANHAVRQSGSSAGYPMYVTNVLNGQPVVRFNSTNGNTGDYFQFTRISTIRTVFWVLKENAGLSNYGFLLGDDTTYQFHRASPNGPLWNGGYASGNITGGTTKLMGNTIDGTATSLPSDSFQLVSLVTAGNVQANQICQDRTANGSWQGDIAEILIYDRALSGDEELQVGTYLTAKYGLTTAYPVGPPATPTGVSAAPGASGTVRVSWTASVGAAGYNVSVSNTVTTAVQVISTAASPLFVTGLSNGTLYQFAVQATNFVGASAYSATVSATPVLRTYTVPLVTNGLVLRMDAAQIYETANAAQLDIWTDSSGAANHAFRQSGSSAGYPMYVTNVLNGQPVVRFNSGSTTGDYFKFTRISTIRTVFWVLKENAGLSDNHFLLGDDSSYDFHRGDPNGSLWAGWLGGNVANGTTKLMGNAIDGTSTSLPSDSFQLVSLVTAGNVQANQICQDRTAHGSWQGDIAEILIYNRALTADEENQVGHYLATKYGLTTTYSLNGQPATVTYSGNLASVTFYGAIGYPYNVERSTNGMSTWQIMSNYPAGGVMTLNDDVSALTPIPASAFYRLSVP